MISELPDFALEVYMGEWEFAARHHLTASDAQTLTIAELEAMADPEQRAEFQRLPLSYTPTWGTPALLSAIAGTYEGLSTEHVLTFAGAKEPGGEPHRANVRPNRRHLGHGRPRHGLPHRDARFVQPF